MFVYFGKWTSICSTKNRNSRGGKKDKTSKGEIPEGKTSKGEIPEGYAMIEPLSIQMDFSLSDLPNALRNAISPLCSCK